MNSRVLNVGHKGADALVEGNTLASFDAALAAGVDMIEFDVLSTDGERPCAGRLVLAHDEEHATPDSPSLDAALAHLSGPAFESIRLNVDVKMPGYEPAVVLALRAHGMIERAMISTTFMRSLVIIRAIEPQLRLGWSVPRASRDYTASALTAIPAYAALGCLRRRLPKIAAGHICAGRCDALMAYWRLVTPRLKQAVADAGGELFAWTVDDGEEIARLTALEVTGIISNDPRLLAD